jgi:hypothetical protein
VLLKSTSTSSCNAADQSVQAVLMTARFLTGGMITRALAYSLLLSS